MANAQNWQSLEDAYLVGLNQRLKTLGRAGSWDWPAYSVSKVSAVVIGSFPLAQQADAMVLVYSVTVASANKIPNPGQAMWESSGDGNWYTFVQVGPSVGSGTYQTQFLSTYVGTNPYAKKAGSAKPAAGAVPLDGGPTDPPPHPPP